MLLLFVVIKISLRAGVKKAVNFQINCRRFLGISLSCVIFFLHRRLCKIQTVLLEKQTCQQTTNERLCLSLLQIMCKPLVDTLVEFITAAARQHQQVRMKVNKQSYITVNQRSNLNMAAQVIFNMCLMCF